MKTMGMLGGMSWESSLEYYRLLNAGVKARLGGLHSAEILMYSVEFGIVEAWLRAGDWDALARHLSDAGRRLENAGAQCLFIATNTMHKVAPQVASAVGIPLISIIDAAAEAARKQGFQTVGLLGTKFTMEEPFYREGLESRGLKVVVPGSADCELGNRIIFGELCRGSFTESARAEYLRMIRELQARGAQAVILGCTELPILIRPEDSPLLLLDTTRIHVEAVLEYAL